MNAGENTSNQDSLDNQLLTILQGSITPNYCWSRIEGVLKCYNGDISMALSPHENSNALQLEVRHQVPLKENGYGGYKNVKLTRESEEYKLYAELFIQKFLDDDKLDTSGKE